MAYAKGQEVRFSAAFTDAAGAAADPSTIAFELKSPGSAVISYAPTKDSVGHYHQDAILTVPGMWYWRWEGAGTLDVSDEGAVQVEKSQFA